MLLPLDVLEVTEPWRSELGSPPAEPLANWVVTDSLWSYYPMATNVAAAWPGRIPLWDPHLMGGLPAFAQGKLYTNPVFLLLELLLPVDRAYSWLSVVSVFIGAVSSFVLLRVFGCGRVGALVGSLASSLNLVIVGWILDPSVASTSLWFPAVFLGVELALRRRDWRWAGLTAGAFALQILSGSILQAFYCAVSLGLLAVFRGAWAAVASRRFSALPKIPLTAGLGLVAGALLAAVQLLPCLELYGQTPRHEAIGASGFLPLQYMSLLVVPGFWGNSLGGSFYWGFYNPSETGLYFGLIPLVLVPLGLAARDRGLAVGLFGLGLTTLLAVYAVPPFRQVVQLAYPVWLNTNPARIYLVTVFSWALLGGLGVDWVVRQRPRRLLQCGAGGVLALAAILALAPVALSLVRPDKSYPERTRALLEAAGWCALTAGVLWLGGSRRIGRTTFGAAVVATAALDLWSAGHDYNPAFDRSRLYPETASIRALRECVATEPQPVRVLNVHSNAVLTGDAAEVYGLQIASGYSSWALSRAYAYARLTGLEALAVNFLYYGDCCTPLLDALNIRYVITEPAHEPVGAGVVQLSRRLHQGSNGEATATPRRDRWRLGGVLREVVVSPPPAEVELPIDATPGAVLRTAASLGPEPPAACRDEVAFEIRLRRPEDTAATTVFTATLDAANPRAVSQPLPVEVDLTPWAGQRPVLLTLATRSPAGATATCTTAAWLDPRIELPSPAALELVHDGPSRVYRNRNALPRAFMVHRAIEVELGNLQAGGAAMGPGFDPSREAVVEGRLATALSEPATPDRVEIVSYEPESVEIRTSSGAAGLLVLADTMYPGWNATVDGQPGPVYYTNILVRGVPVPEGEHTVVFRFQPESVRVGAAISGVTLLLVGIVLAASRPRTSTDVPP